jgi:sensor histidine kinase YesM
MKCVFKNFIFIIVLCFTCRVNGQVAFKMPLFEINQKYNVSTKYFYDVVVDDQENVWGSTSVGIYKFSGNSYTHYTTKDGLCDDFIVRLGKSPFTGEIWASGYNRKISIISYDTITSFDLPKSDITNSNYLGYITDIKFPNENTTILVGERACLIYDNSTKQVVYYNGIELVAVEIVSKFNAAINHILNQNIFHNNSIINVTFEPNSTFQYKKFENIEVLLKSDKLLIFNNNNFKEINNASSEFWGIEIFDKKSVLFSDGDGYLCEYHFNNKIDTLLENKFISRIAKNNKNELFFASLGKGLIYTPDKRIQVADLSNQLNSISGSFLWKNGIYIFDGYKDETYKILQNEVSNSINAYPLDFKNLNPGVFSFELNYNFNGILMKGAHVFKEGILFFNNGNQIYSYTNSHLNLVGHFKDSKISCIYQYNSDTILFGTKEGLYLKTKNATFEKLNDFSINTIQCYNNKIYIGTNKDGVLIYQDSEFKNFQNRLVGVDVKAFELVDNVVLIATNSGLFKVKLYDKKNMATQVIGNTYQIFDESIINLFLENNNIIVVSDFGISKLPKEIVREMQSETFYIDSVKMNGFHVDITSNPKFKSYENNLEIFLRCPSYKYKKDVVFEYKVNDAEWQTLSGNILSISDLRSDKYSIKIRIKNAFNKKSIETIRFVIKKKIWNYLWFQILFLFLLIGISVIIFLNYRKNRKRTAELEKLLKLGSIDALNKQINPHFISNALNSIYNSVLKLNNPKIEKMLIDFSRLMRNIFYVSSKKLISLQNEIDIIESYVEIEKLRIQHNFTFVFKNLSEIDSSNILIPPLILQPLIENAIWHGIIKSTNMEAKEIMVSVTLKENVLFFKVEDNGSFVEEDILSKIKKSTSGLNNTFTRVTLMNELYKNTTIFNIYNRESKGVRVEFCLPLILKQDD